MDGRPACSLSACRSITAADSTGFAWPGVDHDAQGRSTVESDSTQKTTWLNNPKVCSFSHLMLLFLPSRPIGINHGVIFFSLQMPCPNMSTCASSIAFPPPASLPCFLCWSRNLRCFFPFSAAFRPSESSLTTAAWTTWTASAAPAPLCRAGTTTTLARPAAPWAEGAAWDRSGRTTQSFSQIFPQLRYRPGVES